MHLGLVQAEKAIFRQQMDRNSDHSICNPPENGSSPLDPLKTTTSTTKWASKLLRECAAAMSEKDSGKIHHLLWMLNELSSPYGDTDQKLAAYFLQALFCKATDSGPRCHRTLISVADKTHSFHSARRLILKFQESSPWTTFGHVASNGAMLEAFHGHPKLHVIDISNTLCTQWPTLLEALATRTDDTPSLRLTAVVTSTALKSAMKEIAPRIEKFARLMGVPFEFAVATSLDRIQVHDDEAVTVNVVEEEADFSSSKNDFVKCFEECLRFYTIYLDMLEESFPATSNERLMLERECSRSIVRVLACDDEEGGDSERREKGRQWSERLRAAGFSAVDYSDDVVDDVKALLKRYKGGWSLVVGGGEGEEEEEEGDDDNQSGIYLAWKQELVVWASVWKP